MQRMVVAHRDGGENSIAMFAGKIMVQKIDVSEMTPDQVCETMHLSIQWMREPNRTKTRRFNAANTPEPVHTAARRRARTLEAIDLGKSIGKYAQHMAEFTAKKREARQKARLEQLNKMLKEEGR